MWRAALSRNVAELRIHFHIKSPKSAGVREWLVTKYPLTKMLNPQLIMRHHPGYDAEVSTLFVNYFDAFEEEVDVTGMDAAAVDRALADASQRGLERYRKMQAALLHGAELGQRGLAVSPEQLLREVRPLELGPAADPSLRQVEDHLLEKHTVRHPRISGVPEIVDDYYYQFKAVPKP